jgi:LuxR family maltose regulon positive regulatory protein
MVIRIRLAQAVAAALRDDRAIPSQDSPPTSLIQALIPAETEGYIRTFVDFGPPVGRLLYGVVQHNPQDHHAREVLSAFHIADRIRYPTTAERDIEPLSARETEVLHYLAKGWTNQEIAQELVIALSTVKKHVSHILGKLDVSNRREAARKARAIGLLVE